MTNDVDQLVALCPPPFNPREVPTTLHWQNAEIEKGFIYPQDFKDVNVKYGSGFFDNVIVLLNPAASGRHMNLVTYTTDLELTLELYRSYAIKHGNGQQCSRLIPIAYTINGDEMFYCVGKGGSLFVILAESRGATFETYNISVSALLAGLLSGSIRTEIFGDEFVSKAPYFVQRD